MIALVKILNSVNLNSPDVGVSNDPKLLSKLHHPGYCCFMGDVNILTKKKCANPSCDKIFSTNKSYKRFHSPHCQAEHVKELYKQNKTGQQLNRFKIFKRDNFTCRYCGRTPKNGAKFQVDHVWPLVKNGPDKDYNKTTSCIQCNSQKGGAMLPIFIVFKIWEENS